MRRATLVCVACGADKNPDRHGLAQHCDPCSQQFREQMQAANRAIAAAVNGNRLTRAKQHKCVDCGAQAFDWDHRDYSRPLDVEPVCRACNIRRGPAKWVRRETEDA